jgi:hypothetical protein
MTKKELVLLWYETQRGHINKCKEKQLEFSDIMWELYDEINKKESKDG